MKKSKLGGYTRFAPVVAGFGVAATLAFSGSFTHSTAQDTPTASGRTADNAPCFLSAVELRIAADDIRKCVGTVTAPFDRRETFDWI
ncbi:hypothetical protein [Streptomyces sp. NPDC018693]|uniref:hypothetical protein n=1 Tax=unclassified Streptomyces TaxID=2593676 RepID=UPI003799EEBC